MEKIISVLAVILVILFFTCPAEEDHQKAVDDKVSEFFEKGLSENPDSAVGAALYMGILGAAANEVGIRPFEVHGYKNWWIFSTAKIENDTTFGILDHVFIIDKSPKKTQTASPQSVSPKKTSKYQGKRKRYKRVYRRTGWMSYRGDNRKRRRRCNLRGRWLLLHSVMPKWIEKSA